MEDAVTWPSRLISIGPRRLTATDVRGMDETPGHIAGFLREGAA